MSRRGMMEGFVEDRATLDPRRFVIAIRRLADNLAFGADHSPFLGSGIEYVQSRPYQLGDPVRSMDWRVTARLLRAFVKEYEAPKSMPCLLVLDTSASMTISSIARSKYETALFVAGGLALACLDRMSPVGLVAAGDATLRIPPSLSRHRVLQWMTALRRYRFDGRAALGERLKEIVPTLSTRALFIILSDLHEEGVLVPVKRLAQAHECVVLQLMDPAELTMRGAGIFRAREAETGREFMTHGRRTWIDPEVARSELKKAGVDHLVIRTDRPFEHALRRLFRNRAGVGRGAR